MNKSRAVMVIVIVLSIVNFLSAIGAAIYGNRQRREEFLDTWDHHAEQAASAPQLSTAKKD